MLWLVSLETLQDLESKVQVFLQHTWQPWSSPSSQNHPKTVSSCIKNSNKKQLRESVCELKVREHHFKYSLSSMYKIFDKSHNDKWYIYANITFCVLMNDVHKFQVYWPTSYFGWITSFILLFSSILLLHMTLFILCDM